MAGVLRYNRESDNQVLQPGGRTINPVTTTGVSSVIICEFCGEKARPSLDLTWVEEEPEFCCPQHQQLCELLVHQMHLLAQEEKSDLRTHIPPQQTPTEQEELLWQKREIMQCRKQEQDRLYGDNAAHPPFVETYMTGSKTLSYQLSACAPGNGRWTVAPPSETDTSQEIKTQEAEMTTCCCCDHKHFGISYHKGGAECLQKYYNDGLKFRTVFPDGSAQVFYPSGLLAVVVVATEGKGRVCIVYDDSPEHQMRALFLSDGRATCYHSHGAIWLSLDSSGGRCLDGLGTRTQHWSWNVLSPETPPTPLRPVILSLNTCVGVRVLGPEQVFVSFLACSRQARFSVGACCVQVEYKGSMPAPGTSLTKEELFVMAGRIRVHLTIKHLHQCLRTPSNLPPLRAMSLTPHLIAVVRRLLEVSNVVQMSKRERDFIHGCLQDCLI